MEISTGARGITQAACIVLLSEILVAPMNYGEFLDGGKIRRSILFGMPDVDIVYEVLVRWAAGRAPRTCTDLSNDYAARTGDMHDPRGTWDRPLGYVLE